MTDAIDRRQKAVKKYLHKVWCTCDHDTESEDDDDDAFLADHTNSPREELHGKSSDLNEDHSRAGVFRASGRRKRNRDHRLSSSDYYIPEENKRRKESASLADGGSHLSDNVSHLSVASANESSRSDRNSICGHNIK